MPALNKLYKEYRDRAAFYVVYIQEAHPIDAWQLNDNLKDDVLVASTTTTDERINVANICVKNLGIEFPALVDEADNRVERAYTGWPDRLYVDRPRRHHRLQERARPVRLQAGRSGRDAEASAPETLGSKKRGQVSF